MATWSTQLGPGLVPGACQPSTSPSPSPSLSSSLAVSRAFPSLVLVHHQSRPRSSPRLVVSASASGGGGGGIMGWLGRAQAAMPIVGLLTKLTTPEGGVGTDRLYYSEYCVRQERAMAPESRAALLEFQSQYGQMARPGVVMFWCWMATVGAGVMRREDVLLGARRMRASLDMEYELNSIEVLLDDPSKRDSARAVAAAVPLDAKAKVAAEAVAACCVGPNMAVDWGLLKKVVATFFPGANLDSLGPEATQKQ